MTQKAEKMNGPDQRPSLATVAEADSSAAWGPEKDLEWQKEFILTALDLIDALVVILDGEGRIVRINRACQQSTGYSVEEVRGKHPWEIIIAPEDIQRARQKFERLHKGHFPSKYQLFWVAKDGKRRLVDWTEMAMFNAQGEVSFVLGTGLDISEQALTRQNLEHRILERTNELSTLLRVSHDVASTLELKPLMEIILEQLKGVVNYTAATIMTIVGDEMSVFAHRGPFPPPKISETRALKRQSANRDMMLKGDALFIPDIRVDSPLVRAFRDLGDQGDRSIFNFVRSAMVVPLVSKNVILGLISLGHSQPNYYTLEQANLVRAFANQVAVSMDNAKLYAKAKRGADVAQAMFNIHRAISHRLELVASLLMIVVEAKRLVSADASVICLIDEGKLQVSAASGQAAVDPTDSEVEPSTAAAGNVIGSGVPCVIDLTEVPFKELDDLRWYPSAQQALIVPILSGTSVIGTLAVYGEKRGWTGSEDEDTLVKLASTAAIAIELDSLKQSK